MQPHQVLVAHNIPSPDEIGRYYVERANVQQRRRERLARVGRLIGFGPRAPRAPRATPPVDARPGRLAGRVG